MLQDIRELTGDPEAYAAELRRRWGGLLSYRYIGRFHASMDNGPADETVTLRRDMRNPTGGLLPAVLGIASPDSGGVSDLEAVPNPVIWSCQVLDPGRDIKRFEVRAEVLKQGMQMAYSRSTIVDADNPNRVLALTTVSSAPSRRAFASSSRARPGCFSTATTSAPAAAS